jgi:hypothetical protein
VSPHAPVEYGTPTTLEDLAALKKSIKTSLVSGRDVVTWTCPHCHVEQAVSFKRDRAIFGIDTAPKGKGLLDLRCDCGLSHEGREDDQHGCGFAAKVPVSAT